MGAAGFGLGSMGLQFCNIGEIDRETAVVYTTTQAIVKL